MQMEDREIKKGKEGLLLRWAAAASPRACKEDRPLGTAPGVRRPPGPCLGSFLPSSQESQACVMASPLPETVVLLHQTLLNPQPGDTSSAAPEPAPPPPPAGRRPPLLAYLLTSSTGRRRRRPPTHPDPASQLRGQSERAKYLRKRGVPIRTALPSGWGQADREGERKERDRERKRSTRSGRGGRERSLLCPSLFPSGSRLRSPRLPPSAPLSVPYSCAHTRSIRPKAPALFSLIFYFLFSP